VTEWDRRQCTSQAGKPDGTSYRCFKTLFVGRAGKTPPCWRSIQQLGEYDGLVDVRQRVVAHAVAAQQFQGVQGQRALASDVTDVLAGRQMVRNGQASLRRSLGECPVSVEGTFSVLALGICEDDFIGLLSLLSVRLLFCAHRST